MNPALPLRSALVPTSLAALCLAASAPAAHQSVLRQGPDSAGSPNPNERHGAAVAAGDFDGDGYEDLATGAPHEKYDDGLTLAGGFVVTYGTDRGLTHVDADWRGWLDAGLLEGDYALLGYSLAAGDFDGDGYDDLAVGAPWADFGGAVDAGRVFVFRGSPAGLEVAASYALSQQDMGGVVNAGELFGWSLAAGSLGQDDGYDDLAVGAPMDVGGEGAISWILGSANGLDPLGPAATFWPSNLPVEATGADQFGFSLSIGNHRADDDNGDLAVGEPLYDPPSGVPDTGRVVVFQGAPTPGLWPAPFEIHPQMLGIATQLYAGLKFGWALAAGNFFGGVPQRDDLAISQILGGIQGGGVVFVLPVSGTELDPFGKVTLDQTPAGFPPLAGGLFGHALAAGDFDLDGDADLAAGAPDYDVSTVFYGDHADAGMAMIFRGGFGGPTADTGLIWREDMLFDEPSAFARMGWALAMGTFDDSGRANLAIGIPGKDNDAGQVMIVAPWRQVIPMPSVTSIAVDCKDEIVFSQKPFERRYIASTTKIMTVLLACEATQLDPTDPDYVSPSYQYTVPNWLADAFDESSGCSKLVFTPFEEMSFHDLMAVTMAVSANDGAHALAQVMTGETATQWDGHTGTNTAFVARMNARAAELGMDDTYFTNPPGVDTGDPYSTAYDMYLLSRAAMANPLFRKMAGTNEWYIERKHAGGQVDPTFVAYSFLNKIQDQVPTATGIKPGSTGKAKKTGCFAARGEAEPWGEAIVTTFGTDKKKNEEYYQPAGDLLELALADCGGDGGGPNPTPDPNDPVHWDVDVLPSSPGSSSDVVVSFAGDQEEDVVVEVHLDQGGLIPTTLELVVEQRSAVMLDPGQQALFGLDDYDSHDGVEICYEAPAGAPALTLEVLSTVPPQTKVLTMAPGDCVSVAPAASGPSCLGCDRLILSNIGATAGTVAVTELGYRKTVSLGGFPVLLPKSYSTILHRDPALENGVATVRIEGLSGPSLASVDTVGYSVSSAFQYDACAPDWEIYGQGWPGLLGEPYFGLGSDPVMGQVANVILGNSAGADTSGLLVIGVASAELPTTYGGVVNVAPSTLVWLNVPKAGLVLPWTVQSDPGLCGLELFFQTVLFDAAASDLLAFSRGLVARLGD